MKSSSFLTFDILWLIEPIRKDLIEIDLSLSTLIVLSKLFILHKTFTEKLLTGIYFKHCIECQNTAQ